MKIFSIALTCLLCTTSLLAQTTTHKVAKGETLYSIAKKYGVKVETVVKANPNIKEDMKIKLGQVLTIPAGAKTAVTTTEKITVASPQKPKPYLVATEEKAKQLVETAKPIAEENAKKTVVAPAKTSITAGSDTKIHIVQKGETVYSIARKYGLKPLQLKDLNHLDESMKIKLGQQLLVLEPNRDAMFAKQKTLIANEPADVPVVEKKFEPVYEPITQRATPVKDPPARENLKQEVLHPERFAYTISERERLIEAESKRTSMPNNIEAKTSTTVESPKAQPLPNSDISPDNYAQIFLNDAVGKSKRTIRGLGMFMSSTSTPGNQYLALYNYADMGSIVKVTNLMSKKVVYVKVIGKVSLNDSQNDVVLKLSQQAADELKVSEDKFLVEVSSFN